MKKLFLILVAVSTVLLFSCSDSGTSPEYKYEFSVKITYKGTKEHLVSISLPQNKGIWSKRFKPNTTEEVRLYEGLNTLKIEDDNIIEPKELYFKQLDVSVSTPHIDLTIYLTE